MTKTKIIYQGNLRTEAMHESGATLKTDAPKDNQGRGEMFSPTDLVGVALASCMLTLMGIAAQKLKIDLQGTTAEVEKRMNIQPRRISQIVVKIYSPLSPDSQERETLEKAAMTCPVHESLHPDIQQKIEFTWGSLL